MDIDGVGVVLIFVFGCYGIVYWVGEILCIFVGWFDRCFFS